MANEEMLKEVLLDLKNKYSQEWKQYEEKTLGTFQKIGKKLLEESAPAQGIIELIRELPQPVRDLLYYMHHQSISQQIIMINSMLMDDNFKNFLRIASKINELDKHNLRILEGAMKKINIPEVQVGTSIISTWAAIVNPNVFIPLHGKVPSEDFRELFEKTLEIRLVYGGVWKDYVTNYLEFLRIMNQIKSELGIKTAFEVAFYLSKYSKSLTEAHNIPQKRSIYLEITKPPGKPYEENHVGRILWSPAQDKYWNGRKGKLGLLKPGDIIIHDVNGTIVGYSIVEDSAKEVTRDKIISIFKKEGIWNDKYSKFAEDWFNKSENDRFYVVKLKDFKELFTELKSLPKPIGLRGVYLHELGSDVLKELSIPFSVDKSLECQAISISDYLISKGYLYPPSQVSQFYVALKTKGFVIISGLTGSGKTKIVQEIAELLNPSRKNFLFLSVRPDWRDSKPLLGYYNPITKEYHKTPLLEFILRAKEDYEKHKGNSSPYIVLLDEMNLAHVEYYFADFLSVLECGRDENGFTREIIKLHDVDHVKEVPKEIKLPPNLYIVGTVNTDETTYSFSPKVLDRAFIVEFHDVDLKSYPPTRSNLYKKESLNRLREKIIEDLRRNGKFLAFSKVEDIKEALEELKNTQNNKYWNALIQLDQALEPYDLHFGYRVVDEIALFFKNAKESKDKGIVEFKNDDETFDLGILMKILPKFHGNRKKLEKPLLLVLKLAKEGTLNEDDAQKTVDKLFEEIFGPESKYNKTNVILRELTSFSNTYVFHHTAKKILRMLRQLYEVGFASFS